MADRFFTQEKCDRCGGSLARGRIMSMYSTECICMKCKEEERRRPDYRRALEEERRHVMAGDRNFKGVGWTPLADK